MKRDRDLPTGVYRKNGGIYLVRRNKWTLLGHDLPTALAEYARIKASPQGGMAGAIERALGDIRRRGKASTVTQYESAAKRLQTAFAEFSPAHVRPAHVRQFLDHYRATPNMANRCRSVLMLAMRLSVEAGECDRNPVAEVKPLQEPERERYLTDVEFAAIYDAAPDVVQCFMALAYLTGQRIGDVLSIKHEHLKDDGIEFRQQKTGARLIVAWTPELREVTQRAKELRQVRGFWLLCQRNGKRYSYKGMRDAFDRARKKAGIEDTTPHDLRAKAASDAKDQGLNATLLLGHSSEQMTKRYLRSKRVQVVAGPVLVKKQA